MVMVKVMSPVLRAVTYLRIYGYIYTQLQRMIDAS